MILAANNKKEREMISDSSNKAFTFALYCIFGVGLLFLFDGGDLIGLAFPGWLRTIVSIFRIIIGGFVIKTSGNKFGGFLGSFIVFTGVLELIYLVF